MRTTRLSFKRFYENIQTWAEVRLVIDRPHEENGNTGP